VYSSPLPPRALARRLADAFDGLDHVRRVGVGFAGARTTVPEAYRAILQHAAPDAWRGVLDRAEEPGDYQRTPGESLAAVAQLAIWHGRFDLASAAFKRLGRQPELPHNLSRNALRLARLGCAAAVGIERVRRLRGGRASSVTVPAAS
jgi:hypothetical protein